MTGETCRSCGRAVGVRPRGLCHRCYTTPEVRERFPVSQKPNARRGPAQTTPTGVAAPTEALPGTEEKIEELARRVQAGEHLFSPRDARRGCQ